MTSETTQDIGQAPLAHSGAADWRGRAAGDWLQRLLGAGTALPPGNR